MIKELIEKHYPHMVELRETFHKNPELGFELPFTFALVKKELEALGLEVRTGFAKTGLIAILRGAKPGKTVMLRADMDALPVQELADVPYKSEKDGLMHGCAHDGHMASMLGAAAALCEMKEEICGNIIFLFQPAEESQFGGAVVMIEDGVMDVMPIDASFSGHLWGSIPVGEIHIKSGVTMASRDEFKVKVIGKGGHGAMPNTTIDPVVMTAQIINAVQTLISRSIDPNEPAVMSICQVYTTGGAPNVTPDFVEFTGTIRAYDDDVQALLLKQFEKTIACICESHGGSYELTYTGGYPALFNDAAMSEIALESARKVVGEDKTITLTKPLPGSEDFSWFSKAVPSCYVFSGISDGPLASHHNPHFAWRSEAMKPFATYLATVALDFLNKK